MSTYNELRGFRWTDQGTAKALAHLYGADLRYCPETKGWYRWNGQIWEFCLAGVINQLAVATAERLRAAWKDLQTGDELFPLREKALNYYSKGEDRPRSINVAKTAADLPEMRIHYTQFDADIWKLGLLNGELDLRTGKFSPPRKLSYLTKRANATYDPTARAPMWEKFISEIFCADDEIIEVVQRMFGYCLTGSTEEQVMFLCVGDGSNGKSTMFNAIRRVMGDYSKLTPFSTFSATNKSDQSNDLAMLAGARFVTISESDEDSFLAEAKLKAATGSDPITCRFLYKELFSYDPQFKIWMGTNQLPGIRGMNYGNFRRQIILHFNATFDKEKRINGLENILFAEAAGILNWMIVGLGRWREQKLTTHLPKSLLDARQSYREEMDIVGKWLEECVEVDKNSVINPRSQDLYTHYREYAIQSGHKPKGLRIWSQELRTKGLVAYKTSGVMKFKGIRIKEPESWVPDVMPQQRYQKEIRSL
jgi:putative DNA primase/helicase